MGFKEWLSKTSPDSDGKTWSKSSKFDLDFGRFRKHIQNKSGQMEIDPDKLYTGISHKQKEKGDLNGISNSSTN